MIMTCRYCPRMSCCQKTMKNMSHFRMIQRTKKTNCCSMKMMSCHWNLTLHLTQVQMIMMILFLWHYFCLVALLILCLSMTRFCFSMISTLTLISCLLTHFYSISFSILSLHVFLYFYHVSFLNLIFVCVPSFLLELVSFIFICFLSFTLLSRFFDPFILIFSWEVLVLI